MRRNFLIASVCAFSLSTLGVTAGASAGDDQLLRELGFKRPSAQQMKAAVEAAAVHPLGSADNPVRVSGVAGQRAYLSRLRCPDGQAPKFSRQGTLGNGPYGTIVDGYDVVCAGKEPVLVVVDMYHKHVEPQPVPGFTIVAR